MLFLVATLCALLVAVSGHGYLQHPPGRNAMWKFGFTDAPINWNLNQNFCGGSGVQFQQNDGKCGICGDSYSQASPRSHEFGGNMYDGRIVETYTSGEMIEVTVKLTANHKGWFQFRICPTEANPTQEVTQECLDEHVLDVEGNDQKQFTVLEAAGTANPFKVKIQLPQGMRCERCVLQWKYRAGNNWGCPEGGDWRTCGLGVGDQETFINCADIKIE